VVVCHMVVVTQFHNDRVVHLVVVGTVVAVVGNTVVFENGYHDRLSWERVV